MSDFFVESNIFCKMFNFSLPIPYFRHQRFNDRESVPPQCEMKKNNLYVDS